ncbi:MAG: aminoacyl-tRNA hydrolase [Halieaceae bacterium]|jgi:PTH1 family peptidyl-tRNA hydrolase|nr:aminoacyl-tRNA hydrolase [Halieaceae bacterium]
MPGIQMVVGLGNPGQQYEGTRHNAGAFFVEALARQTSTELRTESKFFGLTGRGMFAGQDLRFLIPTTFMNRSGQAVAALAHFYKIPAEDILIAHDELDIPPGCARFKQGGGHGGHNGLRDIIPALGGNKNFWRLRVGIGHPGHASKVSGWVLAKPSLEDRQSIDASVDAAIAALPLLLKGDKAKAMTQLHSFNGASSDA